MTATMPNTRPSAVKRQIPRQLGIVIFLFDIAALFLAFITTKYLSGMMVYISSAMDWGMEFHHFDTRRFYYIFLCMLVVLRFITKGHYSRRVPWLGQVEAIIKTIGVALLFDALNYYIQPNPSFPALIVFNWSLCILYVIIARWCSIYFISRSSKWILPIALVGDARMVMDTFYAFINDGLTGYEVKVILLTGDTPDFNLYFLPKNHPPVELRRDVETYPGFIEENRQYYYIFGMDELRGENKDRFTRALDVSQVEYAVIPHTKTLDVYGMEPHYFFGNDVMLLHRRDKIRSPSGFFLKRVIDIAVSSVAVIVLGILTAIVWVMKKIEKSDTPVFYGGHRIGRNGELFNCWKFCTMRRDADEILNDLISKDDKLRAEWDQFQKLKNDPRIDSKISKLLRKTSLDELPQLWNVFVGDMSLVGPRPILESQRDDYGDMIQQYYAVRPGLTGLWQVSGRNETSFQQRVYWDSWYIRNWSLWYDFVIIFKTIKVLITGSGAY